MPLYTKITVAFVSYVLCTLVSSAQPTAILGIVNLYSSVTAVLPCPNIVRVENPERFAVGDTVLLIQMKGATADTVQGADFGRVMAMNRAGRFERNIVDSIGGNAIRLRYRMHTSATGPPYEAGQGVQLIRIPSYSSAQVVAPLTCPPWDGKSGGVLMITVHNTLILDADITADGKGFDHEDGIARTDQFVTAGGLATAGLGGAFFTTPNDSKSGGGGGAQAGCGGSSIAPGSRSIAYGAGANWIFMGGGGGSAGTIGLPKAKGGRGGGIVIVDAPAIIGNDAAIITADGLKGANGTLTESVGGAGGGAGGVILSTALSLVKIPLLKANGGAGGTRSPGALSHGAGGGGGAVLLGTASSTNQNSTSQSGGVGGGVQTEQRGCVGVVSYNNTINESKQRFTVRLFSVVDDTTVCAGTEATLVARVDGTVAWSDGTTTLCTSCDTLRLNYDPNSPDTSIVYYAVLMYTDGCLDTATVKVTVKARPVFSIPDPPPFCDSIVVAAQSGFARYAWNTGDTTSTIVVRTASVFTLTVFDSLGCFASASVTTRFRGDTVLVFETLPMDGSPLFIDSIFPSERSCTGVPVRNRSSADLVIVSARMAHGVEISVPLAQFPIATSPTPVGSASAVINVCTSAGIPGVYVDTMFLLTACGELACPLTATILETKNYSRCNVRITSDGEIEVLAADARPVVVDMMGRELTFVEIAEIGEGAYFVRGLPSGAYVLRVGSASHLVLK